MNDNVYLFELDSVRNSIDEIKIAQQVMFDEIVLNGNNVVMSFNQITDSKAFLYSFNDEKTSKLITKLFAAGRIKFNQYTDSTGKVTVSINIKAIFSLLLFFAINYGLNLCQESLPFSQNTVFGSFAYSLIVMGIFCILGSFINKFTKTPDILDIFHNFRTNAKDWFYSRKNVKNHTYYCKLHDK